MITKKMAMATALAAVFMLVFLGGPVAAQQQTIEELKDKSVRNEQGEEIGTIKEVIASPDGQIEAVIIQKGGFMGLGGEEERISWSDLQQRQEGDYLVYAPGAQTGEQDEARFQTEDRREQAAMEQQRQEEGREGQTRGEIIVQEGAPEVTVDQTRPQVRVEQPSPQVRVQQPKPDVTVTQPPPEITVQVEQPKPQVEVRQQQPRVEVQQPKPEVSVAQPKPEVKIRQQEPEVSIRQSKPEVQIGRTGQPEVYIEKQGQAQVQIEQQGKPQVDVVRKETQEQQKSFQRIEASKAQDWVGRKIAGKNGEELGTVESNYLSEDRNYVLYLIVQGEEDKMHPIPAGMVKEAQGKEDLTAEIDKSTFDQSPSFSANEQPELNQQQWSREIRSYYETEGQSDSQQQQ